jgi:hypothetical protein
MRSIGPHERECPCDLSSLQRDPADELLAFQCGDPPATWRARRQEATMSPLRPVPPRGPTVPFQPDPLSLVTLRRTYRDRVTARPDLAGALDRILEEATSEVAAAGVPYEGEPPIRVSAIDVCFGCRRSLKTA